MWLKTQSLCIAQINDNLHWCAIMNSLRLNTVKHNAYLRKFLPVCQPVISGSVTKIVFKQNWMSHQNCN